jgi:hypothetical protein
MRRSTRAFRATPGALASVLSAIILILGHPLAQAAQSLTGDLVAAVAETYDSNITLAPGNEQDDFITQLSIGVVGGYEGKTSTLKGEAHIHQYLYLDHSEFNNTAQELGADWTRDFGRAGIFTLSDDFRHAEEPLDFDESLGRTSGRYSSYRNRLRAAHTYDMNSRVSVRPTYENEIAQLSREDLADSQLHRGGAELDFILGPWTILTPSYSYGVRHFSRGADVSTHSLASNLRRYLTKQVYVDAKGGVDFVENSINDETRTRPLVGISITDELDGVTTARLAFVRQTESTAYAQESFTAWRLAGQIERQLSPRFTGAAEAFVGQGKYVDSGIEDELWGGSVRLAYEIVRDWRGFLSYRIAAVDSSQGVRDYEKNSVSVGVGAKF